MNQTSTGPRILIYSHDTFGLGHLRRCRAIAHALVEEHKHLSVLILSGSPIIGSFDFRARVDFVRIPGVIKLRNGAYTSLGLHIDTEQTLEMRASIILHTARIFGPDIFLVDKEPLGLRGEVGETLAMLKARGCRLVLGLRDVLDEPRLLRPEWRRKNVFPALRDLYDDIWVYGLPQICDPLEGIDAPATVRRKVTFTGYLPRRVPANAPHAGAGDEIEAPYLLVTAGGGGDGEALMDWVLGAYECSAPPPWNARLVFGPFLNPECQARFHERIARLPRVSAVVFDAYIESLMAGAAGVVAMGGYNTFCEILSLDKRALIVPRQVPRMEQYIRASRARDLGLVSMLIDDGRRDPFAMATALRHLPQQRPPSETVVPGLLDGFVNLNRLVALSLAGRQKREGVAPQRQSG
ncbi:MAG: glycosyltransferase family protein [Alphaproteobacteria bacterium]